jgi:hypothetical protein
VESTVGVDCWGVEGSGRTSPIVSSASAMQANAAVASVTIYARLRFAIRASRAVRAQYVAFMVCRQHRHPACFNAR